jgi:4-amino-4-deoxy-L-arabinose transferase-like glycosyltransferase
VTRVACVGVDPRSRKECESDGFRNSRPHAPNMRWIAVKDHLEGSNQTVSDTDGELLITGRHVAMTAITAEPESAVTSEAESDVVVTYPTIGRSMPPRRFAGALAGVVLFSLAFRVGYVLLVTRHQTGKFYDAFWYGVTSSELSSHQFFRIPFHTAPTASHPPLTTFLLGGVGFVVPHETGTGQLLTMAVLGAGVVLCVGLLGKAVAGPRVGLVAAALAALAPNFWIPSGILMSETPSMLFMALILLALIRLLRKPTFVSAALVGAACGAQTLVRAELILFVPALLVPGVLLVPQLPLRKRLGLLAVGLVATTVVIAPWVGRNLATFKDPTYLSSGEGLALSGANCAQTYSGPGLGGWNLACAVAISGSDESVQSALDQHAAFEYATHHADRLPEVVLARIGRLWDFYQPNQMATVDVNEGRPRPAALWGLGVYYAMLPLAVSGIVIYRRRRIDQWFLLVPAGVTTIVSALVYGTVRFRAPFEVCLVVLAAPPLVLLAERLSGHRPHDDQPEGAKNDKMA